MTCSCYKVWPVTITNVLHMHIRILDLFMILVDVHYQLLTSGLIIQLRFGGIRDCSQYTASEMVQKTDDITTSIRHKQLNNSGVMH